jgi:hypothetical protein
MGMEGDYRKEMAEAEAELEYLRWFKQHADFGPADGDVHQMLDDQYEANTGNQVPKNWRNEE